MTKVKYLNIIAVSKEFLIEAIKTKKAIQIVGRAQIYSPLRFIRDVGKSWLGADGKAILVDPPPELQAKYEALGLDDELLEALETNIIKPGRLWGVLI